MASSAQGCSPAQISTMIGARAYLNGQQVEPAALPAGLITDVGLDSSSLGEGALFAALPGTRTHGAKYAAGTKASAILTDQEGAAVLAEAGETRPVLVVSEVRKVLGTVACALHGDPSSKMTVIGVTGTAGKTTTSYLLEAGLREAGAVVGLIGTTGTRIDGRPVPTSLTTPEAPTLQQLFDTMVQQGVTHVVMEVSSHALDLGRVQGTHFAVAGFTNLSQDHLDFHPTMEDYFAAKVKLFSADSALSAAKSVVVTDDSWGQRMAQLARNVTTVNTRGEAADIRAEKPEVSPNGAQRCTLHTPAGDLQLALPLPGRFNVANAALAVGIAQRLDVDMPAFLRGIANVSVPGRMQRIDRGQDFVAVVDYAHKPAAVAEILDTLRAQTPGRVGIVLGAGGNRDHSKRPIMGREAAQRADLVIITDDNPRDEDPALIRQAVLEGAKQAAGPATEVLEIGDRARAIEKLVQWATAGDSVVVAGKGHETGQLVAGVNHHFDDREELASALDKRMEGHQAS